MHSSSETTESRSADAGAIALAAIGWTCSDQDRAERLLALTGLDPESLRAGLDNPTVLVAALDFLADHEPDLVKCAEALALTPEEIIAARHDLGGGQVA